MKSVKDFFTRGESHNNERQQLKNEAKQFRIPSEWMPQAFKYMFFFGLALLNMRLFMATVPGIKGFLIGCVAIISEALALYALHNFSRSTGLFRLVLGITFLLLMAFAITHAYFSFLDMIGVSELAETAHEYARRYAFPILATLIGVLTTAICLTHPKNVVRLTQAQSHTDTVIARAEAASKLSVLETRSIADRAELDWIREKNQHESQYLTELSKQVEMEQEKFALLSTISDLKLREKMAYELGIDPESVMGNLPPLLPEVSSRSPSKLGHLINQSKAIASKQPSKAIASKHSNGVLPQKSGKFLMAKKLSVTKGGTKDNPEWYIKTERGQPTFRVRKIDYGNRVMLKIRTETGGYREPYGCYLSDEEWAIAKQRNLPHFIGVVLEKLESRKLSEKNNRERIEELITAIEGITT